MERSEEHTSELQSHRDLHSFPTRRSSDLFYHLRQLGVTFRLGGKVAQVGIDPKRDYVFAELESGKRVHGDALIYAVGRQANGDQLHLEAAGLAARWRDRKSTRLNSSHTEIYTLSLHDALPISSTICANSE